MVNRSTLAVTLVVVVLMAGCSGFVGGDGAPEDPEEFEYADGYSEDGVTDGQQAIESYKDGLKNSSSYTGNYDYDVVTAEGETSIVVDYRVNFEEEAAMQEVDVRSPEGNGSTQRYFEGGQVFQRSEYEGETGEVAVQEQPFPADDLTAVEAIEPLLTNTSSYNTSVEERNGTSVVVYESSDVDNANGFFGTDQADEVTGFQASMAVDSDGVVHSASYELSYVVDGEERSVAMTFEVTDLGETTIDQPEWANSA